MPTGFTADVQSGKITSLRDYALTCARGMGALVMMRDLPFDAPIPERFEPSSFYAEELEKVQAELATLRAMAPGDWQAAADAEFAADERAEGEYFASKATDAARYDEMIAKVTAWDGAPEGLKEFMLDQLRESRRFDCTPGSYWKTPTKMTGAEWKAKREGILMEKSARYAAERQKEVDRTESRNAWLATLRSALDGVS